MSENQTQATPEISPAAYDIFVRKLFNRSGDNSKDFTHAVLGIATEIDELLAAKDDINGLEETGDLQFYLVAMKQIIDDVLGGMAGVNRDIVHRQYDAMVMSAARTGPDETIRRVLTIVLDDAKRWVGYGKQPDADCFLDGFHTVLSLVAFVGFVSEHGQADVGKAISANVAKLSKRYKGGTFSQTDALIRDLEAEREALASA